MQVLAAVPPAADVDAADLADLADRALDPGEQDAELCRELVGQVARLGEVLARLEQQRSTAGRSASKARRRQRSFVQR